MKQLNASAMKKPCEFLEARLLLAGDDGYTVLGQPLDPNIQTATVSLGVISATFDGTSGNDNITFEVIIKPEGVDKPYNWILGIGVEDGQEDEGLIGVTINDRRSSVVDQDKVDYISCNTYEGNDSVIAFNNDAGPVPLPFFVNGGTGSDSIDIENAMGNVLVGGYGPDNVFSGSGADYLFGGNGFDQLIGGAGNDTIVGGRAGDSLYGGAGDDREFAGQGNDLVSGGSGNDILMGRNGDDRLWGGSGNDTLFGDYGNDYFDVTDGIYGYPNGPFGSGNDVLDGGNGFDVADVDPSVNISLRDAFERVANIEQIHIVRPLTDIFNPPLPSGGAIRGAAYVPASTVGVLSTLAGFTSTLDKSLLA